MKRVILATFGTIAALVGLLSYKSHRPVASSTVGLPSAALATTAAPSHSARARRSSSAPPNRRRTTSSSPMPRTTTASGAARTVMGSAVTTRYGVVQVKVVTSAKRITAVSFAQLTAFDGHSAEINNQAGPQLLQETLSAQSAHVDGVSGATYTSDGYRTSLQYALDQVGIR